MKELKFYKDVLHKAPFGYVYLNILFNEDNQPCDALFIEANRAFERITGLSAAASANRKFSEVNKKTDNDHMAWLSVLGELSLKGGTKEADFYLKHTGKWLRVQGYSPEKSYVSALFIDITKEKQRKEELSGMSQRLNSIMQALPDMLFVITSEGVYLEAFAPDESMLKWPRHEVCGKTIYDLFPKEQAEEQIRLYKACISENKPKSFKYTLEVDNSDRFFEARIVPFNQSEVLAIVRDITEITFTEKALTEGVIKYKQLVEEIKDVIFSLDQDGIITYMSPVVDKLTGFTPKDYIGREFSAFIHPSDQALIERDFRALKNGVEKPADYRIKTKSGGYVWVRSSTREVRSENNNLEYRGVAQDITESKKAEEALIESEERFRALHNATFGGVGIHDKGIIIECNQGLSDMTGYTRDELIGMNGLLLIAEHMRDTVMEKILAGYEKPYEAIGLTKDGKEFPLRIEARNIPYKGKKVRVTEFRDISEQKTNELKHKILYSISQHMLRAASLEELLEQARRELSQLLDTTNFFMAYYHPETDTLKRVLFKDEKDDFTEWKASDTFSGWVVKHGKTLCLTRPDFKRHAAKKGLSLKGSIPEAWLGVPLWAQGKGVGVIVIQSYTDRAAYDQQAVIMLEMVARELSLFIERERMLQDLTLAKEQAEESDRLKSAFLANMSHEIRTPMNGILGFAELLKQPNLEGEKQKKFIEIIEKSGQRMLNIINNLVDISKIEAGQEEVYLSGVNINEQLSFTYDFFKPEFDDNLISLKLQMPGEEYLINTDVEKFNAIMTNLLKNAVKYTDEGEVRFGFTDKEDHLEFFVRDTGIGISADRIDCVFDRFVQADSSLNSPYEGAGLGLAIVRAYVEMLGGRIWLDSEPGKGSAFYFTLPVD
ncbi:MAG: PAS domain S-box protein [Bacteroidales bacterium]|nr:PAS domain S-box protein [Bacteroidales bacterium]